jgi:outer membrane protein TolC
MGLRNNRTVKSVYIDRVSQKFDLRVAEDRFAPKFTISAAVARQRIGRVTDTTVDISPGVTMVTKTGATFQFAWNNAALLDSERSLTSIGEVTVTQPLLRGAGVEVNMAPVQQARLGEAINRLRLKAAVSETIGNIMFLAQEELKLAERAVVRGKELLSINNALISSGRMAAMDAVQTEADIENQRLRVLQVKQKLETGRLNFLNLLGLDLGTKVVAAESLTLKKIDIDIDQLIQVALTQRQDYQGQLSVIEQNRLGIVLARNEQLWDISLFARGRFGGEFAKGYSTSNVADVIGGVRITFPVNDIIKQQQLVQADTTHRSSELQLIEIRAGVETQIRDSAAEVGLLWQQLAVGERSRDLATQAIEIEKAKLNVGRSTTFQVRALEDNLRSAENQLLALRIGYLNALTRLDLQLGTTLDTWRIGLKD